MSVGSRGSSMVWIAHGAIKSGSLTVWRFSVYIRIVVRTNTEDRKLFYAAAAASSYSASWLSVGPSA
jgi:hypothetical protein